MMEPRTLEFIAASCQGQLVTGERSACVSRVCTDSRLAKPGDLFVAIKGDRFDGHDYAGQALGQGAVAALVNRSRLGQAEVAPAIHVDETRQALGQLAARYRQDFDTPVIAIGGSNGKTTTKDILATLLGQRFETLSSEASFNNDIGVPLTLLRLQETHRAAVVEVGSNHPGEMQSLLSIVRPTIGVLTSIGREHLEFFGDLDGVLREEGALAEALPEEGCLFVNGAIEGGSRRVATGSWPGSRRTGRGQNLKSFRRREIGTEYTVSTCWAVITPRMLRSPWRLRRNWA